ncbi:Leucine Rich Repeat family protein [Histomonas meleagridis]|uniref:Leucine Rich Repeat family protein n=1 Tax=Histomonas meleagridis TaxID=135588 RepID=UPI00355A19CC|nr:Leucine Rich Repeat family protein [Histomonas meleagridis]KAH0800254.1 Leucine Rich Repeat family protein [Histomonas meleagridis]
MEIERDLLDAVAPIAGLLEDEKVICCVNVIHTGRKNKKINACMLVSEFGFFILERGTFSKNLSVVGQLFWNNLKKIELVDKETFIFSGSSNIETYTITHRGAEYLLKLIIKHIKNVLIPSEYPEFVNLDDSFTEVEHQHEAFINRFRFQLRLLHVKKFPKALETRLSKIICKTHTLDIGLLPNFDGFTDILLDCLQIEPTIFTLILPIAQYTPCWTSLANCLRRNTTLNHVVTNDPASKDLERVAEALASNPQGKLKKITFCRANFQVDHFPVLEKLFRSIPFEELDFDNSMCGPVFQQFLMYESICLALLSLKALTIKKTRDLNLDTIFQMLPSLKKISLIECDVDVGKLCQLLSRTKLEYLEIKGGSAPTNLQAPQLPLQLSTIMLEDITWEGQSFSTIFKTIMTHQPTSRKLTVSLSSSHIQLEQWNQFYHKIQSIPPSQSLVQFIWSENNVQTQLFQYLHICSNLTTIVLNGCFSSNSNSILNVLTEFLNAKKTIESLTIKGTKHAQLEDSAQILFSNLKKNQTLKFLDVSNNDFGSQGLLALGKFLVSNKTLCKIVFANNGIDSGKAYETFFETVMNRGPKLEMEWPEKEINEMHKAKLIKRKAINHMMDLYAIIINGNLKAKVIPDDDASDLFSDISVQIPQEEIRQRENSQNVNMDNVSYDNEQTENYVNEEPENYENENCENEQAENACEESDGSRGDQWYFALPEIPVPNIEEQARAIEKAYNTNALLKRLRQL